MPLYRCAVLEGHSNESQRAQIAKEVVNKDREVIPQSTITKPPSAELRHNQKDSDDLPDYEVLDPILRMYIEDHKSPEEIVAAGHAMVGLSLGPITGKLVSQIVCGEDPDIDLSLMQPERYG